MENSIGEKTDLWPRYNELYDGDWIRSISHIITILLKMDGQYWNLIDNRILKLCYDFF